MPATKVIKAKPVEATRKPVEKTKAVKVRAVSGAEAERRAPPVRKGRASSCPRRDRCERAAGARGRSASTAPTPPALWPRTNPDHRRATGALTHAAVNPKCREPTACPAAREPREQRSVRAETKSASQSPKAFTVIPPNPKKRREIQRKAEAELAALEELRLSRAMAYVSINPSSVGGCMSLEEVRLKQQQEMMQAKRKQKPVKQQVVEQTPVLTS